MIPPLPPDFDPDDPTGGPSCCTDLFDAAEGLLDWLWEELEECIGDGTGPCGEMQRYVSFHRPVVRPTNPNVLAVYLNNTGLSADGDRGVYMVRSQLNIELWEGCYPIPDAEGRGPSYLEWHEANRHVYAHGVKLYDTLLRGMSDGTIAGLLSPCSSPRLGSLIPAGSDSGIAVGWMVSLEVIL